MNETDLTISQATVPTLEVQISREKWEFINFLSILCIVWLVAMRFYYFHSLIF